MNAHTPTTTAALSATANTVAEPDRSSDLFSTALNTSVLAGLSLRNLSDLYDACRTLTDVAASIGCQPRFQDSQKSHLFNPAGEQADLFHELAAHCLAAIMDEAVKRAPTDREEAQVRAWLLARDGVSLRDEFAEFFAMVAQEAATVAEAEALGAAQ